MAAMRTSPNRSPARPRATSRLPSHAHTSETFARRCSAPASRAGKVPVGGPIRGDLRCEPCQRGQELFLVADAALLLEPAVLDERERSPGKKCASRFLPADLGVDPMERRGREHGSEALAGKLRVLKPRVHELHRSEALKVLLGERQQVLPGLKCRDLKPPGDETVRQLTASAPDLEHPIAAPDPGDPTGAVDELVGIRRAVAVVFCGHVVEGLAVAACEGAAHSRDSTASAGKGRRV